MLADLLRRKPAEAERSQLSFNQYLSLVEPWLPYFTQRKEGDPEKGNMQGLGLTQRAYTGNGVVFACSAVRLAVFSQIMPQWQNLDTKKLFGTVDLDTFETPWVGGSFSQVLGRMEQDATCAGNSFWYNAGSLVRSDRVNLARLSPEKTVILSERIEGRMGGGLGWAKAGYLYTENEDSPAEFLELNEVAHYAPMPDPMADWRGMSWLTPILREVDVDNAFNTFKQSHMENSATPNLVITFDPTVSPDDFKKLTEVIKRKMTGSQNAGKTLALGGGADVKIVGANFEQLALKAVQGAGETRIAAAAGVPPVVVGLSEGLSGSSLNAGNYGAARRRFADVTMRDAWQAAISALSVLEPAPSRSRLWYSDRDVSFLQEDVKDEAEIREGHARTIRTLVEAGYTADTAVNAAVDGDFAALKHTGKVSVQLQEPGANIAPVPSPPPPERAEQQLTLALTMPDIHIDGITVPVTVGRSDTQIDVHIPEQPAPVVHVAPADVTVNIPEQRATTRHITHDARGRISTITENPL